MPRDPEAMIASRVRPVPETTSTRTGVDLGLRLDDEPTADRLTPAGSFGSGNITHLAARSDVDEQVHGWLRGLRPRRPPPLIRWRAP